MPAPSTEVNKQLLLPLQSRVHSWSAGHRNVEPWQELLPHSSLPVSATSSYH